MEIQILKQQYQKRLLSEPMSRQRIAVDMLVNERTVYRLAVKNDPKLTNKFYSKAIRKVLGIPYTEEIADVIEQEIT